MKKIAFYLLFAVVFAGSAFAQQANSVKDSCLLKGDIELVTLGPDVEVEVRTFGADLDVEAVTVGPNRCGEIRFVTLGAKTRVRIVNLGADFTIRFVDKESEEMFFKEYERVYGKPFEYEY
ncbi:MAG: hypothetical protein IKX51_03500 [Bacteroidales bacterium]|nr:hypothetical protein [Bacteroidales bacterium]